MEKRHFSFLVNSLSVNASYFQNDIEEIFMPLVKKINDLKGDIPNRLLVYLAGPPGVGKTTLSLLLEQLSKNNSGNTSIQSIGLDGFHYSMDYVNSNYVIVDGQKIPMRNVKGCPESFDVEKLRSKIRLLTHSDTMWPYYDRTIHDSVDNFTLVNSDVVLIEGNWLLLNEFGWKELIGYCSYSIFVYADRSLLIDQLINRKIAGGASYQEAENFVLKSDCRNIERVISNRIDSDLILRFEKGGNYIIENNCT